MKQLPVTGCQLPVTGYRFQLTRQYKLELRENCFLPCNLEPACRQACNLQLYSCVHYRIITLAN
jgi:hypothetical protein